MRREKEDKDTRRLSLGGYAAAILWRAVNLIGFVFLPLVLTYERAKQDKKRSVLDALN